MTARSEIASHVGRSAISNPFLAVHEGRAFTRDNLALLVGVGGGKYHEVERPRPPFLRIYIFDALLDRDDIAWTHTIKNFVAASAAYRPVHRQRDIEFRGKSIGPKPFGRYVLEGESMAEERWRDDTVKTCSSRVLFVEIQRVRITDGLCVAPDIFRCNLVRVLGFLTNNGSRRGRQLRSFIPHNQSPNQRLAVP